MEHYFAKGMVNRAREEVPLRDFWTVLYLLLGFGNSALASWRWDGVISR